MNRVMGMPEHRWLAESTSIVSRIVPVPRKQESAAHRQKRIEDCESSGMLRSENIYGLSKRCFECHIVGNEKLIAAGHKTASAFEFVSWSEGEVRHNFLLDKQQNAAESSLLMEAHGGDSAKWRRVKFVVGTLCNWKFALRRRAVSKNPAIIPQIGGIVAASYGKIAQINGMAPTEEHKLFQRPIAPLLGLLFVPQPNDQETYSAVADKIATQAKSFVKNHDGSKMAVIDATIETIPKHYSQQFKQKYMREQK